MKNLVKQNTSFKNSDKPTCIDLILTNCLRSFQNTDIFETGLSYFHKLTFTVLKQHFPKQKPKVVIHRQCKNFHNNYFRIELENALLKYDFNNIDYDNFVKTFLTVLDKQAPIKNKTFKGQSCEFYDKTVKKGYNEKIKIT